MIYLRKYESFREEHTIKLFEIWNQISNELGLSGVERISLSSNYRIQIAKNNSNSSEFPDKCDQRFRTYDDVIHNNLLMNKIGFICQGRGYHAHHCEKWHEVVPDRIRLQKNSTLVDYMPQIDVFSPKWTQAHHINPAYDVTIYGEISDRLKEYLQRIEISKKATRFDL